MSTNNAYHLSEEWVKINESTGYLHNTSQQNIEYIVVPVGVEPPKNGGKVIMPRNFCHFELPDSKEMYVRVFRKMPSGYIPTAVVNSEADLFRQEDNPLEGSTNSLTIGLSTWRQTAWYPLEWCVIAENALWQCIKEHEPSTEFLSDVALGRWKILSADGSFLSTLTFNNDGTVTITRGNGTQTVTAISATNDGNGNNIVNTYMTIAAVNAALANYATTSSVNSAIGSVNSSIGRINTALGQAQSSLNALANSAIKNITKKNDYTITVTKGDNSATDITLGTLTYVSVSDLVTALAPYSKTSDLNNAISTVNNTIANNKGAIESSLSGAVDTLNNTIANNKSAIESSLSGAVDTLNDTIANNKSALQNAINGVEANTVTNVSADATSIKQTKGNGTTSTVLTIDTDLNTSSTNPVQNKAIANKVNDLQASIDEMGITGNCTVTVVQSDTYFACAVKELDGTNDTRQIVRVGYNGTNHTSTFTVKYGSTITVVAQFTTDGSNTVTPTQIRSDEGWRYGVVNRGFTSRFQKSNTVASNVNCITVLEPITITGLGIAKGDAWDGGGGH